LKHVKQTPDQIKLFVCCKHKDTSSDPTGEEASNTEKRQQQHETSFSPTLVIRSYQQVDRKLITSVGGCCYSKKQAVKPNEKAVAKNVAAFFKLPT
jgi:hypothetical protein